MSQYKSPNVSNIKIDGDTTWTISKCLADQNWIKLGRELKVPDPKLKEIQGEYKHDFLDSAYHMLKIWRERKSTCTVQDLLTALRRLKWIAPIPEIEKHMKRYVILVQLPNNPSSTEISKWSNLNQRILSSIASKMPITFYLNCHLICKSLHNNRPDRYTYWMNQNRANWSKSSFQNAMERKVNCQEIYLKSSEEWKKKSAPTLIKEIDTRYGINHISFSNDSTMLAVCHYYGLWQIYDLKDFSNRFSRNFKELVCSSYFNSSDSCILVCTDDGITYVIANAVGLPILHSISNLCYIRRPWLQDNIFHTFREDDETDTITFWLNKITLKGDADNGITESLIHRAKGSPDIPGIIQTGGRNILLYAVYETTKLAFKIIPENMFGKYPTKQNDEKIEIPDNEVDCKGYVYDYTFVPDRNTKELYVLTERKEKDFCFMIIDLVNFELKTSILLVPHDFQYEGKSGPLASNSKCIISGNGENHVSVWDLKSGACSTHLNEDYNDYYRCEIHPTNPELVITAGYMTMKFKLRRLITPK